MYMKESDIVALDFIIDKIIETKRRINYYPLVKEGLIPSLDDKNTALEFKRLLNIIKYVNCAKVIDSDFSDTVDINENTNDFKNNGGFKTYFQEELKRIEKKEEREKLETALAKSNIEANTLNIENASKNKWFTWINIAIGVLNLILLAIQILTD